MDEKASLTVESGRLGEELTALNARLAELDKKLIDIPNLCKREQKERADAARTEFDAMIERKQNAIFDAIRNKKDSISQMIDSYIEASTSGPISSDDIKKVEEHLGTIYPPEMIEEYICMDPIEIEDDDEAEACYRQAETATFYVKQGHIAGMLFNGMFALLDKAADYPQIGVKVAGIVLVFFIGCLFLSPFLFITTFAAIGSLSVLQGKYIQSLLRDIYSVKMYASQAYDHERFEEDKQRLMEGTIEFLQQVQEDALEELNTLEFMLDPDLFPSIVKKYDDETLETQKLRDDTAKQISIKEKELEDILKRLELVSNKEKELAELARQTFLGTIDWKKEWMDRVFLEVTAENKVKRMTFGKKNTIYYSKDSQVLLQLSRLIIWQTMLHMHPDFCSSVVIDYRYNGGDLMQFNNISDKCIKINYSDEDRTAQLENIVNRIRARTNNILGTCPSIEEFNQLMASYNATGEYYVVVHVFGLSDFSQQYVNCIRNGPRVGYFFKFYWTFEELQDVGKNIPLEAIGDFFEITDNPLPRTLGALRRVIS